ncbi:MAG: MFS transporter [Eubacterium sp.]|nr:MFS transporter [Eubacterium sp.]
MPKSAWRYRLNGKNIKMLSVVFMSLSVVFGFGMATVFVNEILWLLIFSLAVFFSNVGSTLIIGVLIGQWFPKRKGTVMGIATLAFPIAGGSLLSVFAMRYFSNGALAAYTPFLIIGIVGIIIALIFIKDYPEQCGAYRDNDKNMTMEKDREIMEMEIIAKKNSVWTLKNTFMCRDFWFMIIPLGILLATSVGAMTQIINILNIYPDFYAKYGTLATAMITVIACAGSCFIGLIDTRLGTKKAVIISCIFAIVSGVLGFIQTQPTLITGFMLLCVFEGAASNFAVSISAQYWKLRTVLETRRFSFCIRSCKSCRKRHSGFRPYDGGNGRIRHGISCGVWYRRCAWRYRPDSDLPL